MAKLMRSPAEHRPQTPQSRAMTAALAKSQIPATERLEDGQDLDRILSLPIELGPNEAELEAFRREHTLASALARGFKWNREQARGVMAYMATGGLFGPLPVGQGKTLLLQYIAHLAYCNGIQKIVLLLPKGLVDQFLRYDLAFCRANVPFAPPVHSFAGLEGSKRKLLSKSNKRGLYLLPFSLLQREASAQLLFDVAPGLLLVDEAYHLKDKNSTTTKRVIRYLKSREGIQAVFVAGSVSDKKLEDYAHLSQLGLKRESPIPLTSGLLSAWSSVISTGAQGTGTSSEFVWALLNWARKHWPNEHLPDDVSGFRTAYKLRLQSARGVSSSDGDGLGVSLVYHNTPVIEDTRDTELPIPGWRKLCALIDQLDPKVRGAEGPKLWLTPDGEQVEHAIHAAHWAYQLSHGFYYSLVWPTVAQLAERRRITPEEADVFLDWGITHHKRLSEYHSILRIWLEEHPDATGTNGHPIDSPLLVASEMSRTKDKYVWPELYWAWREAKDAELPGMAKRDQKPIRVCPFKVNAVVEWAKSIPKGEGGIIWYHHVMFGRWIYEALVQADLPAQFCGEGAGELLRNPASGTKFNVASIRAHHKGLNLQGHHWNVLVPQWPRSSIHAEQLVGRVHRQGQKRESITIDTILTLPWDHFQFGACMVDALYQHETGAGRQKLIYGSFDPMPKQIDPNVLKRMGLIEGRSAGDLAKIKSYFDQKFGT